MIVVWIELTLNFSFAEETLSPRSGLEKSETSVEDTWEQDIRGHHQRRAMDLQQKRAYFYHIMTWEGYLSALLVFCEGIYRLSMDSIHQRWNETVILTQFSSLATLKVPVQPMMKISSFPFQWAICRKPGPSLALTHFPWTKWLLFQTFPMGCIFMNGNIFPEVCP